MAEQERLALGKTGIQISTLGIGTWQWGDKFWWGYGKTHTDDDIRAAFQTSLEAGINFFDTAEVYGLGRSETLLGGLARQADPSVVVATKFMPFPWRFWRGALKSALRSSLERLGFEDRPVDVYQIHWPMGPVAIETWAEALAEVVKAGLARAVGVSNYNVEQMRRAYNRLQALGVPLAANQVPYHLLNREVERSGLLALCRELGVTLIAYSPLAQGILSGKYTPKNPPPGLRNARSTAALLAKAQPLVQLMREVGQGHAGKSPVQVALNWVLCKGAVPIPGAKNARQALELSSALGWRLTSDEVEALDRASDGGEAFGSARL